MYLETFYKELECCRDAVGLMALTALGEILNAKLHYAAKARITESIDMDFRPFSGDSK